MSRHEQQPQFVRDLFTAASKFAKTVRDINSALIRTLPGLIFIQGTYVTLSCRAGELWAGDFYLFSSSLIVCRCFSFSFLCYTLKIKREYRADMVRDEIRCCSVGRSSILVVHFLLLVGKSFGHYSRLLQEQNDMLLLFSLFCYTSIWFWVMCFLCDLYRLVVNHRPADVSVTLRKAWWWNPSVAFCCQLTRTTTMSTRRQVRRSNLKRALISWRWQELPRGKGSRRIAQKLRTNTGTLGAGRLTRLMK